MGVKNIVGELTINGSKVITEDTLPESSNFSGSYNDLTDKPDIPSALSDLSDDATHRTVSDTEKATWNAKSDFSGSYNDLTNKPTIPSISGLATETYVDNKVASFVDSAPETLNTLNELAAALGDDPNFATTVATEIGKKVDKTTTVNGHALSGNVTVTKSDVGLGSVVNTGDSATPVSGGTTKFTTGGAYTELAKKVDKVDGKGLSTNDYTTDDKNKLDYLYGDYSEGLAYTLSDDGAYYKVSGIGTCADTDVKILPLYNGLPVTSIDGYAFDGCSSLASITIPDSVTSIGSGAFEGCTSLTSITIPDSVTEFGQGIFYNCTSLTDVHLGKGITKLGSVFLGRDGYIGTFEGCVSLTNVTIPDSITYIGNETFSNCSSLATIMIPDSVTEIRRVAFYGCTNLTIYCEADSQPDGWDANWNYSNCPVVWGASLDFPSANANFARKDSLATVATSGSYNDLSDKPTIPDAYTHPSSGVTAGSYNKVTVDTNGHVTAGSNPTTLSGHGITDAYTKTEVDTALAGKAASSHGNHVPTTETANNARFLRNDNTWQTVTPANIGAAAASHTHSYLEKTTYEKSAELACGSNGKVCLGKFGAYDTNITIELNSTTSTTYHATIVIHSQNVVANGTGGTVGCYVYEDADNHITPLISVFRPYGSASRQIEVYANLSGWSKNLVHVQGVALSDGGMTDVLTSVTEIPSAIDGKTKVTPVNVLTTNFASKSTATTSAAGLMSASDKSKLDGLQNSIDTAIAAAITTALNTEV